MKNKFLLWLLAFLITVSAAYYQRITGPTYPISDITQINNTEINYKLFRSHGGTTNHTVSIAVPDTIIRGTLNWKRYKTDDDWTKIEMQNIKGELQAELPHQPPAGKLEYFVLLRNEDESVTIPSGESTVIRFKGDVPAVILILHIIGMFGAMLLSTRTGLEIFNPESNLKKLTYWTIGFLAAGGLILGPIVQQYAFGALWTGFPFGYDLTDNKTAIAFIGWLSALIMLKKSKYPKRWALAAAVILIAVYLIPHSMMGSELDYSKLDKQENKTEQTK